MNLRNFGEADNRSRDFIPTSKYYICSKHLQVLHQSRPKTQIVSRWKPGAVASIGRLRAASRWGKGALPVKNKGRGKEMRLKGMFVILLATLVWGCRPGGHPSGEKPVVLVSILPQKTFVEKIGGDDFTVSVLIPHGANPSTYSLLPAQMEEISRALIWFRMGYVGFELSWAARITEIQPRMKVTDLSQGVALISGSSASGPGQPSGTDPHTWLSPAQVKIMASHILEELVKIHPTKKEEYTSRYHTFLEEISRTDAEISRMLASSRGKKIISYHPSLTYFARDYGLEQLSVEQGGKEPTPAHLAWLAETAKRDGIRCIYIQSEFDRELAAVVASEIGGSVIQIVPLNPDWSNNLISIARLISAN